MKAAIFNYAKCFYWSTRRAMHLGWTWAFNPFVLFFFHFFFSAITPTETSSPAQTSQPITAPTQPLPGKYTEIVRKFWLVKNLWFSRFIVINIGKPIEKGIQTPSNTNRNQKFGIAKKQNNLLTQPLKSVSFHVVLLSSTFRYSHSH